MDEHLQILEEIKSRVTDQPEMKQTQIRGLYESIADHYTKGSGQAVKDSLQQTVTNVKQQFAVAYQKLQKKMQP